MFTEGDPPRPEAVNIMICGFDQCKIGDFGLSRTELSLCSLDVY
jgi:serine/threonine protein kinase